jgi:hypothetical protein
MNVNTPDGRIRGYGFEVVANVATIAAIRRKFPLRLVALAWFPGLVTF